MANQNTLKLGEWNVLCEVCGFKKKSGEIRKRWDGLLVCREDWEPRHPSDFIKATTDDPSVPFVSPDDNGQQADNANTDIEGNTFPPVESTDETDKGTQVDTDADNIPDGTFGLNNSTL